ncbi:tRNA (guanine(10)-N2)-methyltransferase-like protein [Diplonema papillatum]|nr:tRNA (guanine(10)-N2)-methyltransferase-like protein [Diplonema papillatum]
MAKELLLYFTYRPDLSEYRAEELLACARTEKCTVTLKGAAPEADDPFMWAVFDSIDDAVKVCSRMVLLRGAFEVWGEGKDYDELVHVVKNFDAAAKAPYRKSSFKFVLEAFGSNASYEDKVAKFNRFSESGLEGSVEMNAPEQIFWVIEDCGIPQRMKQTPLRRAFFARQICLGARKFLDRYSLKTRKYIGTTTMVPELCMLMCNEAGVKKNSLVWDPCCGTGSVLVSAAHYGGLPFGSDIDGRVLGTRQNGIFSNCEQYGFPPVELIRLDLSQPTLRPGVVEVFDAIITDPPYGRRESRKRVDQERIGRITAMVESLTEEQQRERIETLEARYIPPPKEDYALSCLVTDIVDRAAKLLTVGGRLVYWHPTTTAYTRAELPTNPCLQILSDSGQSVTIKLKRRLVVMEKNRSWTASDTTTEPVQVEEVDFHFRKEAHSSKEYQEYQAKREVKKKSARDFREQNNVELPAKLTRSERTKLQKEQAEKKKAWRAERDRESRVRNLAESAKRKRTDSTPSDCLSE